MAAAGGEDDVVEQRSLLNVILGLVPRICCA